MGRDSKQAFPALTGIARAWEHATPMRDADHPDGHQSPGPSGLRDRDIVCVGFADWETEIWTNQHHLMSRLGRENRVLFVESLGLRQPRLARRDLARIARRILKGIRGPRRTDSVYVVSPLVLPWHGHRLIRALNRRILASTLRSATRRLGLSRPILWAYVPQAEPLIDELGSNLVVYHCVDDIAAQPGVDAPSFEAAEIRFVARADLVLASAPELAERLRRLGADVIEVPNVADTSLFATALEPGGVDGAMAALPGPRAVFTGAIVASKLDFALLVDLARLRPSWSFALVGPVGLGAPETDVSSLSAEPNIHLLGPRAHRRLPAVLRGADAGLIPYARNRLTESIFPMKVYEYLAAGLPVLATPLPALSGLPEVVTAGDAAGLAGLLDAALADSARDARLGRSTAAMSHSWERRLEEIARAIAAIEGTDERPAG